MKEKNLENYYIYYRINLPLCILCYPDLSLNEFHTERKDGSGNTGI